MKEPVEISEGSKLEQFSKIVSENLEGGLSAITSQVVEVKIKEVYKCDGQNLLAEYENQAFVKAKEVNTNLEVGLIFKVKDITMLADFMLAGEGESKEELDDEIKDAAQELVNQLLGSLNVPVEEVLKKKFSLKLEDIIPNVELSSLESSEYIAIDFQGSIAEKQLQFRFYLDDMLMDIFEKSDANKVSSGGGSSNNAGVNAGLVVGPQNLELLLDIDIPVSVRMGSAKLFLKDILGLGPGNIVELEQNADESIELAINGKVIARGEVVIVDGYFGFRIKEIVSRAERIKKLKD